MLNKILLSIKNNTFDKFIKKRETLTSVFVFVLLLVSQTASFAQNAKFHVDIGVNYLNKNQYIDAYQEFKMAIEKDPTCAEAYYNLGRVYKAQGSTQEAIAEFQKALRQRPDYAEAKKELKSLNALSNTATYNQNKENRNDYYQQTQTKNNTKAQRTQTRESISITNVTLEEVCKNPDKYTGKYVEWQGKVDAIYKDKWDMLVLVNTNQSINAKINMDYLFLVVFPQVLEANTHRISNNDNITVKGKIENVQRIYNENWKQSPRRQPIIKPIEITCENNDDSPYIINF